MQKLSFSFDYGGCCIWDESGAVEFNSLTISDSMLSELINLCEEFDSSLNWKNPLAPSSWTKKQFISFFDKAEKSCQKLQNELSKNYEVVNCIDEDRRMYMDGRIFAKEG